MTPFRIEFLPLGPGAEFDSCANVELSAWVQMVEPVPISSRKLAVVGGSPDLLNDLEELRTWDGDIWAINGTCTWLIGHGITSTLFSVDPAPFPGWMLDGVKSALLASCCDLTAFKLLSGNVRRFHLYEHDKESGIRGGCTSALRTMILAHRLGYSSVHYFGCSGSFDEVDHCSHDIADKRQLIVRAGGVDYKTYPEFYIQSQGLSDLCREFEGIYVCRSRGLFKAMMDYPDSWEVVAVSGAVRDEVESVSGRMEMYNEPYKEVRT